MTTLLALAVVTACDTTPMVMSSQFTPPVDASWPLSAKNAGVSGRPTGQCRIHLADVRDMRSDPQSMGSVGGRAIHATDAVAWTRSGLESLRKDSRLRFVDEPATEDSDLVLTVELLKAYVIAITSDRATNVVLRVRYERQRSVPEERIYRGIDTNPNWTNGEGETQSSFDDALTKIIADIDRDVSARCGSITAANSDANARP